jgi:hypothetical protein
MEASRDPKHSSTQPNSLEARWVARRCAVRCGCILELLWALQHPRRRGADRGFVVTGTSSCELTGTLRVDCGDSQTVHEVNCDIEPVQGVAGGHTEAVKREFETPMPAPAKKSGHQ